MSGLSIAGNNVIFTTENTNKTILSTDNYLKNKSRIPMHSATTNGETVLRILKGLIQKNRTVFPGIASNQELLYLTVDAVLISELITSAAPFRVAEFGCTAGDLSYNLTEVFGKFNPASTLCFISNTIGNESGNQCLDHILLAENLPDFSMVYADYAKTNLADNAFDIVLLNGTVQFEEPSAVIAEALRITKENGLLLCCTREDYLLDSCFRLVFSAPEEYALSPIDKLLVARKSTAGQTDLENTRNRISSGTLQELLLTLKENLLAENPPEAFRPQVKLLEAAISLAIRQYNIKQKLKLIELKDAVLDYMNYFATEHKDFYKARLEKLLDNQ